MVSQQSFRSSQRCLAIAGPFCLHSESAAHPEPSRLGSGPVTAEARSSDAEFHHSPSRSHSPDTARRSAWGHCPVEK